MNAISKERQALRLRVATVLAGALMITACASTPAPTAQLQAAQQAIAAAERTDASRHAAAELGAAQAKLASANTAVHAKEMDAAARLADESRVEAELAAARTASVKARMVNEEMKRSTGTLIDEMQRNAGEPK
jgi:PBP1b-binding outer membrane lipoprotein LpoB